MAKLLVTGAAGFLGSHLVDALLAGGHEVIGMDNVLTGNWDNLAEAVQNPRFRKWESGLGIDPITLDEDIDGIFHMASPASPIDFDPLAIKIIEVNAFGAYHLLNLAREKSAWFMMASTSEVYGDPLCHPQVETYFGNVNPIGPRSVYDESKRLSESLTRAFSNAHGLKTSIIRIFNTYGPRMRKNDGRVVPNFIRQALEGEDITIHGDGSQTRSFCFVDDLIAGILRVFETQFEGPVNLGMPKENTVLELAQEVIKLTNSHSKITHKPMPADDPKQRRPDITLAKEALDWSPHVSLQDGLTQTVNYFQSS